MDFGPRLTPAIQPKWINPTIFFFFFETFPKIKANIISNPNLFRMNHFMILGNCESSETQDESKRLSENYDNDDTEE